MTMKKTTIIMLAVLLLTLGLNLKSEVLYTVDGQAYEGKLVGFKYGNIIFNIYKFGKFHSSKRFPLYTVWKIIINEPRKDNLQSSFEMEDKYKELRKGKRSKRIMLAGTQKWVDTGIEVKIGQDILFSVSGAIFINKDTKVFQVGEMDIKWDKRKPMPNQPLGALIAKVASRGAPFYVGDDKAPFHMSKAGNLFIGINDYNLSDNAGQFTITIYY